MYFCIHFYIRIHQHFQSSFSTLRFLLKKCIFLLARVLQIAVCPGNSRTKQQPSTKEIHHDPNTPHPRRNRIRNNHHQKHPRHIKKEAIYGNRLPRHNHRIPRHRPQIQTHPPAKEARHVLHPRIQRHRLQRNLIAQPPSTIQKIFRGSPARKRFSLP